MLFRARQVSDAHTIFPTLPPLPKDAPNDQYTRAGNPAAGAASRGGSSGGYRAMSSPAVDDGHSDASSVELSLERVTDVVEAAFGRGTRSLGCVECAQHADTPPTADEMADTDAVHAHAEAECRRALMGRASGLAVQPQTGHALVWWHAFRNGSSDPRMWHAGCVGRRGAGRIVVQKFKTPMAAVDATRLEADGRAWRRRILSQAESLHMKHAAVTPFGGGAAEDGGDQGEETFDEEDFWAKMDQVVARISQGE